jgi:hypothetical protein
MRVFPDANFLVAAGLVQAGDYRRVLNARRDTYVTSEHVLTEVTRNMKRLGRAPDPYVADLRAFMEVTDRFELLPAGTPREGSGDRGGVRSVRYQRH